jgi:hypothetical protein
MYEFGLQEYATWNVDIFPNISVNITVTIFRVLKLLYRYRNGRWVEVEAVIGRKRGVVLPVTYHLLWDVYKDFQNAAKDINPEDGKWNPCRNVGKPSVSFAKLKLWKPKDHNDCPFLVFVFMVMFLVTSLWNVIWGSSQRSLWRLRSSGLERRVVRNRADISEENIASIFSVEE